MIAVDSSTIIRYINGKTGADVDRFDRALAANNAALPPVVVTEVLSDGQLPAGHRSLVLDLPLLPVAMDYWVRAGDMRALLLAKGLRARIADTLVAQACIDIDAELIAHDPDFRHFAKHCGLKLA
jgi:predicted nucleic acid-binding protein